VGVNDTVSPMINCDDVEQRAVSIGEIRFARRRLGAAAGAARIGCSLFAVEPGAQQMPAHVHGDEEEIVFVLRGGGLCWQDEAACEVVAGDAIAFPADGVAHTFIAGSSGLELLVFADGSDTGITWLPRAGVMWCGPHWVPVDAPHPFEAEAAAGPLALPEPSPRPANVVAMDVVEVEPIGGRELRQLGRAAGSVHAGLNHIRLPAGSEGAPPHCHALEEELFIVLSGSGTLVLGDEERPIRAWDVIARPPATGVPHSLRAGEEGLTYLVFGTRVPGDSVYYSAAGKVRLRGLGVTLDVS
jgi:uncharacterized cupin superfamily protein